METIRSDSARLTLIPPFSPDFSVYGTLETENRARAWARRGRYLLASGVATCAHGFYLMASCPAPSGRCCQRPWADHANLWVPDLWRDKDGQVTDYEPPFLLFSAYEDTVSDDCRAYAAAHGLTVDSQPWRGDDWYGHGTLPIRLGIPPGVVPWPIEREVAALLNLWPTKWPAPLEEVTGADQ